MSSIKNQNLDVLLQLYDNKQYVDYRDEIAKSIIKKSSIEFLCELYHMNQYKYYQNKILKRIIKIFDYQNEKHYELIEKYFSDTTKIVKGIIKKTINIYPYKEIDRIEELKSISLNGRFSIGYGKGYKIYLMDNDKIVCTLEKNAKGGDINNQGTQILCEYDKPINNNHKMIYDVTNPNNIIARKILLRDTPDYTSSTHWSPNGKRLAICQNRLMTDYIGPVQFNSEIMGTSVTGSYRDIHLFDLLNDQWELVNILSIPQEIAHSAIWSEDGKYLAVLYTNKKLKIWHLKKSEVVHQFLNVDYHSTIGYSNQYLATVTELSEDDYRVDIYDIKTWQFINSINTIALNGISMLYFHPQEPYLIIKDHIGYTNVWNFFTKTKVSIVNRDKSGCFTVFNETGDKIISGAGIWYFNSTDDLIRYIENNKYNNFKNEILEALNVY